MGHPRTELSRLLRDGADVDAIRSAALAYLESDVDDVRWHPVGFVKLALAESSSERVSLHVWHPMLRRQQQPPHICHSHGWRLGSVVLAGELLEHRFDVRHTSRGNARVYAVRYADEASVSEATDTTVEVVRRDSAIHSTGNRYVVEADEFHRTELPEVTAVTAVTNLDSEAVSGITVRSLEDPRRLMYERLRLAPADRDALVADAYDALGGRIA